MTSFLPTAVFRGGKDTLKVPRWSSAVSGPPSQLPFPPPPPLRFAFRFPFLVSRCRFVFWFWSISRFRDSSVGFWLQFCDPAPLFRQRPGHNVPPNFPASRSRKHGVNNRLLSVPPDQFLPREIISLYRVRGPWRSTFYLGGVVHGDRQSVIDPGT